ncbi:ABC transporter permease [Phyllobacterium phragmitis]|uniref:ABC transporter permease n=1 Tax=Phyllobacterium phragmitis TaxID=2670329 RepID=UPI0038B24F74
MNIGIPNRSNRGLAASVEPTTGPGVALQDIAEALTKYRLALIFGWQDVAQRYRRSRVGAFWLTLNMAVFIGALGLIFGTLFQSDMREFLPYLCAGIISWGFISTCLSEGCTAFSSSDGIILQVRMPLFTHILRTLWRNVIIFAHNIVIFPVLALILGRGINFNIIWAVPGFLLVCMNLAWVMLILAILCARFRDMTQVVTNVLQVLFYATPIMWMVKILPDHVSRAFIEWNPFYHFIELVRAPLLGHTPTALDWGMPIAFAIAGWGIAIAFFGKYRWRVAYWL